MESRIGRYCWGALLATLVTAGVSPATASPPPSTGQLKACFDPYESVQVLRGRGELLEAEKAASACSRRFCPAEIQDPCVTWLREIQSEVPSLIVTLRDAEGSDLAIASLLIDGRDESKRGSLVPIPLNPGKHKLKLASENGETFEREVQLVAGEQKRIVSFTLKSNGRSSTESDDSHLAWTSPFVLGGTGLFIAGTGLATVGTIQRLELDRCKPNCSDGALSSAHNWLTAADIGFVAAGVGLGGALLFLFLDAPSAQVSASIEPGRAFAHISGTF